MISLKIIGDAGQGIKYVSAKLAKLLAENGYEVTLINDYSPFIRFGKSEAKIVFSKEKIENPIQDTFDYIYDMTDENLKKELEKIKEGEERINITLLKKIISDFNLKEIPQ